jgi:hypothetical protein
MDPANAHHTAMFNFWDSAEAVDPLTLRIKMKQPFVPTLTYLATMHGSVVAPEGEKQFGDYMKPESAIGTGPWMLDKFEPKVSSSWVRRCAIRTTCSSRAPTLMGSKILLSPTPPPPSRRFGQGSYQRATLT